MSSSKTSNSVPFRLVAGVTIIAAALAAAFWYAQLERSGGVPLAALRLATKVAPHNAALLRTLGRRELELNQFVQGRADIIAGCKATPSSDDCLELAAAAAALNNSTVPVLPATASLEARSGVAKLEGSKTAQAQELYVLGLVRSSQRVLASVQEPSAARYVLQAQLDLALRGKRGADEALKDYQLALRYSPTSSTIVKQALAVSRQTGNASLTIQLQHQLDALTN